MNELYHDSRRANAVFRVASPSKNSITGSSPRPTLAVLAAVWLWFLELLHPNERLLPRARCLEDILPLTRTVAVFPDEHFGIHAMNS